MTIPRHPEVESVAYLRSVFSLDPLGQIEEVFAARGRYLDPASEESANVAQQIAEAGRATLERRDAIQQQVDDLRKYFWEMPAEQTSERIRNLEYESFPDLKMAIQRLSRALATHAEMERFGADRRSNQEFWRMLKEVLIAAPRDAGRVQQTLLLRIAEDKWMRRQCRRMVKWIRKQHPVTASLAADWLDEIMRSRPVGRDRAFEPQTKTTSSSRVTWGGAVVGLLVLVRLAGMGANSHSQRVNAPRVVNVAPQFSTPRASSNPSRNSTDASLLEPSIEQIAHEMAQRRLGRLPPEALQNKFRGDEQSPFAGTALAITEDERIENPPRMLRRRPVPGSGTTDWPSPLDQKFEAPIVIEEEPAPTQSPRTRSKKKFLADPNDFHDPIPADSILKPPLETRPPSRSRIFPNAPSGQD